MNSKFRTIIALILTAIMLLSLAAYIVVPYVSAGTSDLQSELEDIQKQREELENKLNKIDDKRDSELEKKEIIDQQINSLQSEIDIANQQLSDINGELNAANDKLEQATKEYSNAFEISKEYIRSDYESGTVSFFQIILSSGSITDFITRIEIVKEIMSKQNEAISKLKESRNAIEASQKKILKQQKAQQSKTNDLKSRESTLEAKQAASDSLVNKFDAESNELSAMLEEVEKLEAQLQQEILQHLQQEGSGSADIPISNGFRYPLDSKWRIITSPFGYRTHPTTGVYKLHTGIDISGSGIGGANIYAAKNGTVSKAGYHRAYGNYCLINHGDGTATLYAHMSSLLVSAGQIATQGQTIGKVGSTGYSTGNHLHFEIIVDGEYVNPVPYFSSKISFIYS